jgi:hypothetical protein
VGVHRANPEVNRVGSETRALRPLPKVEKDPDGHLDLWAREHYKSTIITFAGAIQEILRNPEITIGIFSHTAPHAKKFLSQVKGELETNTRFQALFPDVLYARPDKESPLWSVEKGIVVKRKSNPKEATVEAHGLVDGQPIGAHFQLLIYDDVVVPASVSTPEQVKKTTDMHALSDNLGARGADGMKRSGTSAHATRSPTHTAICSSARCSSRACTRRPTMACATACRCS